MNGKYMLLLAIFLEVIGTATMKFLLIHGHISGYAAMLAFIALSYFCLSKAVKTIPISLAYAAWEALGLVGTAFIAWLIFQETMSTQKFFAMFVILAGLYMIKKGTSPAGGD